MTTNLSALMDVVASGFGRPRVLVVGDLMLDKYEWGEVERISPEAPVPVLRTGRQSAQPGGAANVAMNLAGWEHRPRWWASAGATTTRTRWSRCCVRRR